MVMHHKLQIMKEKKIRKGNIEFSFNSISTFLILAINLLSSCFPNVTAANLQINTLQRSRDSDTNTRILNMSQNWADEYRSRNLNISLPLADLSSSISYKFKRKMLDCTNRKKIECVQNSVEETASNKSPSSKELNGSDISYKMNQKLSQFSVSKNNSRLPTMQIRTVKFVQSSTTSAKISRSLKKFGKKVRKIREPQYPDERYVTTPSSEQKDTFNIRNSRSKFHSQNRNMEPSTTSAIQADVKPYPPLGTLGPYGENWFRKKEGEKNHRRKDKSSTGVPGVEIMSLYFPKLIKVGDNITLNCKYRLLGYGQKVYSVNWWRNDDQFFTFGHPHDDKKVYNDFRGIKVDKWQSTNKSVVLLGVNEETSGEFKCEVMTEGPAFRTAVKYRNLTVVVPPSSLNISKNPPAKSNTSDAEIRVPSSREVYRHGEQVRLNCTASSMKPKPQLVWIVNDREVSSTAQYPDRQNGNGRVTSSVGLTLDAPSRFIRGRSVVSCRVKVRGQELTATSVTLYAEQRSRSLYSSLSSVSRQQPSTVIFLSLLTSTLLNILWNKDAAKYQTKI